MQRHTLRVSRWAYHAGGTQARRAGCGSGSNATRWFASRANRSIRPTIIDANVTTAPLRTINVIDARASRYQIEPTTKDGRRSNELASFVIRPSCSQLVAVPPILFLGRHLSPRQRRRPLLVWRVLPAIAVAAAMRASAVVQTPCGSHRLAHPTHLAPHRPAQSPSRRHRCRRWPALTRPFHPSLEAGGWRLEAGLPVSNPQPPVPS